MSADALLAPAASCLPLPYSVQLRLWVLAADQLVPCWQLTDLPMAHGQPLCCQELHSLLALLLLDSPAIVTLSACVHIITAGCVETPAGWLGGGTGSHGTRLGMW